LKTEPFTLPDPAEIAACAPEQLIGLNVRLAALMAVVAARLAQPIAPPASTAVALLDADEVAAILKIPKSGVYEAARRGTLGSVRVSAGSRGGRSVRFTRAHVDQFIKARSRPAR